MLFKNNNRATENRTNTSLTTSLENNKLFLKTVFQNDDMVKFHEFKTKGQNAVKCLLVFIQGMVDDAKQELSIIKPIMQLSVDRNKDTKNLLDRVSQQFVSVGNIEKLSDFDKIVSKLLDGFTLLLIDGQDSVLVIESRKIPTRSITEPASESVLRGPREGFTESISVNMVLIRKRIRSSDLSFEFRELGRITKTKICICYIKGIADDNIVQELNQRLDKIDIDGILESNYIEELISDSPLSPFKTIGNTERPDIAAANMLEGKIVVLCDNTPFALTLPYLFVENFQNSEDYYIDYLFASFNRILRFFSFFLSTSVPAIYLALVAFHQEMIPTPLLLSISIARKDVPFPTIVEFLMMMFAFEIVREGGTRLPSPVGNTISFVGALIIGQAAVSARLISAPIVIMVALTGISTFLTSKILAPSILLRFIFLLLSAIMGLFGYMFGILGLIIYLTSLRSFGVPYLLNPSDIRVQTINDQFVRLPWFMMKTRPKLIGRRNPVRQAKKKA